MKLKLDKLSKAGLVLLGVAIVLAAVFRFLEYSDSASDQHIQNILNRYEEAYPLPDDMKQALDKHLNRFRFNPILDFTIYYIPDPADRGTERGIDSDKFAQLPVAYHFERDGEEMQSGSWHYNGSMYYCRSSMKYTSDYYGFYVSIAVIVSLAGAAVCFLFSYLKKNAGKIIKYAEREGS